MIGGTVAFDAKQIAAPPWMPHGKVVEVAGDANLGRHHKAPLAKPIAYKPFEFGAGLAITYLTLLNPASLGIFEIGPERMYAWLRAFARVYIRSSWQMDAPVSLTWSWPRP